MSILKKMFGQKRPSFKKDDTPNFEEVAKFVTWFIKNEPFANVISNRSNNTIFNEGHRPKSGTRNNPESFKPGINSLADWFIVKIYLDLNILKDVTQDEFRGFIDILDESGRETLNANIEIATKYDLNFENFVYEREIEKIPAGTEREWFKINFLDDNVTGAEIRILAWLYHKYFGKWYQLKEKRVDLIYRRWGRLCT